MKRWTWMLCGLTALVFMASAAIAADAPKADAPKADAKADAPNADPKAEAKAAIEAEMAIMVRECKLTEEQQKKFMEAVTAAQATMADWEKANADKLAAFKKAQAAAVEAKDEAAFKKAIDDARPMLEENRALGMKQEATIMGVLTPEQQNTWRGFMLCQQISGQLRRIGLTDEQVTKLRPLCDGAAKELAAVKGEGEEAMKAQAAVFEKLRGAIKDTVLTAEQKAVLEPPVAPPVAPPAEKKPEGAAAPAPEKKPAEKPAAEKPAK